MHGIQIDSHNLRDRIYEVLRDMILRREIKPGQKIIEDDLAKQIGVSRTPLREALYRLENEEIIKIIPRRGAFVRRQSKDKVIEILEIREVLEGLVTRLATFHMDEKTIARLRRCLDKIDNTPDEERNLIRFTRAEEEFHTMILDACQNKMLKNMMETVNTHLKIIRLRTVTIPGRAKQTVAEHREIVAAMAKGDAMAAEDLMRKHIESVREVVLSRLGARV